MIEPTIGILGMTSDRASRDFDLTRPLPLLDTDRRATVDAAEGYDVTESLVVELVPRRSDGPVFTFCDVTHPGSSVRPHHLLFGLRYSVSDTSNTQAQGPSGSSGTRKGEKFVFRGTPDLREVNSDAVPHMVWSERWFRFLESVLPSISLDNRRSAFWENLFTRLCIQCRMGSPLSFCVHALRLVERSDRSVLFNTTWMLVLSWDRP